ncbi:MAG: hypothetical protein NVS2B3_08360 [Vulcanimicrobiaceae bacterium]
METRIDEIAPRTYRLSTFVPQAGLAFNQFLIDAAEPMLFHTGMRALFPMVSTAMRRVMDPARLRWIAFGHYEADECGAMNEWLAIAPQATVMHGAMGVMVSIADQAARPPRGLADGETIDLGDRRITYLATPHVPHGWDAGVLYEREARTLFAGDLFTAVGDGPVVTTADIVSPALATEDMFHATALAATTATTIRRLGELDIATLALMHAPAFAGDARGALRDLADAYATRLRAALA